MDSLGAFPGTVWKDIVDKVLVNLRVLACVEEGDKIDQLSNGFLVIQKPSIKTIANRMFYGTNREKTLKAINELIRSIELVNDSDPSDEMLFHVIRGSVHGFRNLQKTYKSDAYFVASIDVFLGRIQVRFELNSEEMI